MNPIEYATNKMWKTVKYTLIFKNGRENISEITEPEGLLRLPVSHESAHISKEDNGKAVFMSYVEKENVFINPEDVIDETDPPEEVLIIMENVQVK